MSLPWHHRARLPNVHRTGISLGVGANARLKSLLWIAVIAVAALTMALIFDVFGIRRSAGHTSGSEASAVSPGEHSSPPSQVSPRHDHAPRPGMDTLDSGMESDLAELSEGDLAGNEYPVDLERLRTRLPDNLYWQLGAPTQDPQALQKRAEEEQRWNELYGKVLANTASEEEVRRYYDHRRQLSEDYIEFANLVLEEYGDRLPERDRGLYELSIKLHSARLAEIPRQMEDALARKQTQDRRREEWRQSQ